MNFVDVAEDIFYYINQGVDEALLTQFKEEAGKRLRGLLQIGFLATWIEFNGRDTLQVHLNLDKRKFLIINSHHVEVGDNVVINGRMYSIASEESHYFNKDDYGLNIDVILQVAYY